MFWVFEKAIFQFSCKCFSDEVQTVFWESEVERSELLKLKFHQMKLLLENGFQATLSPKTNVLSVWKEHFSVFFKFLVTKLKPFSGKVRQRVQKHLNQNLIIGSFLKNGFEVILSSKTNVLSVWKGHFSFFCKFLSDKVETILWESEAKRWKLCKSKFGHMELLRKWFCVRLKMAFFSFLQIFGWNRFLGKARQCCKSFFYKVYFVEWFLENAFKSLFDHSRLSLPEFLNTSNVSNVSIRIFNWS